MLTPNRDCSLSGGRDAVSSVRVPLNAPRIQGTVDHHGVEDLFLWGAGPAGRLAFDPPLDDATAVTVRPNVVTYRLPDGSVRVAALPGVPALVVSLDGAPRALRLTPPRRSQPGFQDGYTLRRHGDGWDALSPWATLMLRATAGTVTSRGGVRVPAGGTVVVALGDDPSEAAPALASVLTDPVAALRSADAHATWLESRFRSGDTLLDAMFSACLHAAVSSRKELVGGRFGGLSAGTGYVMPPRTYFRDSYWTLQALLPFAPEVALDQLRLLAEAVADDGEAPSGVIVASAAGDRVWRARLAADPGLAADHHRPGQWWSDHVDSPYYVALLARDALNWAAPRGGRRAFVAQHLHEPVAGVPLVAKLRALLERGRRLAADGAMPIKPFNDRDWADNVYRHGHVTYDVALYHGALLATADLLDDDRPSEAGEYRDRAAAVARAAAERLFDATRGHFVEFRPAHAMTGESHLTLDSLVALRTGMASDAHAAATLEAAARILETRANHEQPYGDWGVMCAYPPYRPSTTRRAKSRFAYRYHNGSDWPYLDGIYAEALLQRGAPGWRYPLTRWFEYGLQQGWPTPVEYYSPPWGRGSPLNGWSAMPAAAMLLGGFGLRPEGEPHAPPWGDSRLKGVLVNGARHDVVSRAGGVELTGGDGDE